MDQGHGEILLHPHEFEFRGFWRGLRFSIGLSLPHPHPVLPGPSANIHLIGGLWAIKFAILSIVLFEVQLFILKISKHIEKWEAERRSEHSGNCLLNFKRN